MRVINLRNGTAISIGDDVDVQKLVGAKRRFLQVGDMFINRADIVTISSKEQYDAQIKLKAGMVLTSQGWLNKLEYSRQSFLKIVQPPELDFSGEAEQLPEPTHSDF